MARPLRIEYAGAVYHVTARGNARESIYKDDGDRKAFLGILGKVMERHHWLCHAYCLMGNHYHLMIETPDGNLSVGMRQLNGIYTQSFNRRHRRVGHVLQGRFKAILVDKDSYLLELSRYIVLNPVRAKIDHKLGSGLEILVSQLYAPFMARPLRIEYAGAVYHVTARGNARESIYKDDGDRKAFLGILGKVMERHNWLCHAYNIRATVQTGTPLGNDCFKHNIRGQYPLTIHCSKLQSNNKRDKSYHMPRKPRFYLPGIPAHIVQRGNCRQATFFGDED